MRPSFNIAGNCVPGEHYMLPPERRLGRVMQLIRDRKYFTLHAGRQTGKTTSARWLEAHYNRGDHSPTTSIAPACRMAELSSLRISLARRGRWGKGLQVT